MTANVLRALIIYMLISSFTPGPGNIIALNTVTLHGLKRSMKLLIGIFVGYYVVQIICALAVYGLNRFLSPVLEWMKYIGAIYLVWLAIHIIRSRPSDDTDDRVPSFWTGFLLLFVNIKIYLYGLTALSGYIVPWHSELWVLLLAEIIIATLGSVATMIWALAGFKIQRIYKKYFKVANWILGAFLVYCAVSMLLA